MTRSTSVSVSTSPDQADGPRTSRAIRTAFEALDRAGIAYMFRKASRPTDPLPAIEQVLREAGFHYLKSAGCGQHRFYVAFEAGRWLKIDAKIAPRISLPAFAGPWRGFRAQRVLRALALRRP